MPHPIILIVSKNDTNKVSNRIKNDVKNVKIKIVCRSIEWLIRVIRVRFPLLFDVVSRITT